MVIFEYCVGLTRDIEEKNFSSWQLLSNIIKNIFIFKKAIKKIMTKYNNFICFLKIPIKE